MAIDVNWVTGLIAVPKADTALTQASPEIRSYDVSALKTELKDLEASEAGAPYTDTHFHRGEITVSGIIYARTVLILDPYSIVFEDGQYTVVLTGANHNVADIAVENQVRLVTNNSAGLIRVDTNGSSNVRLSGIA